MRTAYISLILIWLTGLSSQRLLAQDGGRPGGPDFEFTTVDGALESTDNMDEQGRYLDALQYSFTTGDKAYFTLSSPDYNVYLAIVRQTKRRKKDIIAVPDTADLTVRSAVSYLYTADEGGIFDVYLTSVQVQRKGSYTYSLHRADSASMYVPEDAGLCWKMQYLFKQSKVAFAFMKGEKKPGLTMMGTAAFNTGLQLFPNSDDRVFQVGSGRVEYRSTIAENNNAVQIMQQFDEVVKQLRECCSGSDWKFEEATGDSYKTFSATNYGPRDNSDVNNDHAVSALKNRVTLSVYKADEGFRLELSVL